MNSIYTVTLPDIGEGVVEGEVLEWLKKPGDLLKQDEPVVIVMTDKATVELPSPYPGKLTKQYYQPGQMAIKDKPLYDIELEAGVDLHIPLKPTSKASAKESSPRKNEKEKKETETTEEVKALPAARKLAERLEINLSKIQGTGKEGRVTEEDILSSLKMPLVKKEIFPEMEGDQIVPHKGIKGLMAKKMAESKQNIPHFSFFEQASAERLIHLRENFKEEGLKQGIDVTFMPFFLRALSLTIQQFPEINSFYDAKNEQLILHQVQHIGIATRTDQGLIVPVLKNVQLLSLIELIQSFEELKTKTLHNQLASTDMKGSTITLSNYGVFKRGGGLFATPIINYPEVAILAVARIQKQPAVKKGEVLARDILNLSWSFDHRVIDGDLASRCSHYFVELIENPAQLL